MFDVTFGEFRVSCQDGGLPEAYAEYRRRAVLAEEFDLTEREGASCFVSVCTGSGWPQLVVAARYGPSGAGFDPGVLVVPETAILFLGAEDRLLAYSLREPRRLWKETAALGFWSWSRHGDVVLAACELELAAWSAGARKLWSKAVEPPWSFEVRGDRLALDVMAARSEFSVSRGPEPPT